MVMKNNDNSKILVSPEWTARNGAFLNQTGDGTDNNNDQTATGAFLSNYGGDLIKGVVSLADTAIQASAAQNIAKSQYSGTPKPIVKPPVSGSGATSTIPQVPVKSNTGLYIGLSVGLILVVAGVMYYVKKKKG